MDSGLAVARSFCMHLSIEDEGIPLFLVFIGLFICYTGNDKLGGILWRNKNYYSLTEAA